MPEDPAFADGSPSSTSSRVGGNVVVTTVASAFVRLSGIAREVVFAGFFGAGMATDAYNAAFRASQFFRELLAEGSLSNIYVPIFADTLQKEGLKAAWALANAFLGALLVVLGLVALLTFGLAEGWIWVIASGFTEDPDKFALSARLTRLLAPFLATVSLASLFTGMLNVRGRFFLPAIAPAAFNLALIAGCFLSAPFEAWTGQPAIVAIALASLVGGAGQFLIQLPALRRDGYRFRPNLRGHPALRKLLVFLVPAFIGIMTVQFSLLVETQFASRFGDGPVSYLLYAFRLVSMPTTIVANSVATVTLAELANLMARDRRGEAREVLREAMTLNSFASIPAALAFFLLSQPLVALMYERGAFTPADTLATSGVMQMYALAVWGICFQRVAVPCFYAIGKPWFPMWVAIGTMAAKFPLAWLLVYGLGMDYMGLPLSHAILVSVECVFLWWGFKKGIGGIPGRIWGDHARILVASALMGGIIYFLRGFFPGPSVLLLIGGAGLVYLLAAHLLGLDGPRQILRRLRLARRPRGLPPSVDSETRECLSLMSHSRLGSLELVQGALEIETSAGRFRVVARHGELAAERLGQGAGLGDALHLRAVMRVGQGPPRLYGLQVGARSFRAEGDLVVEGQALGPVVEVPPAQ